MTPTGPEPGPLVIIVADDLIWSSRLASIVARAGGWARTVAGEAAVDDAFAGPAGRPALVIVDLGGRRYDGVAAVAAAPTAGVPGVQVKSAVVSSRTPGVLVARTPWALQAARSILL